MSNIMYTVDGRKVAVIGKLNNQETEALAAAA